MDCRRFEDELSNYIDGLLGKLDADAFRAHALACRDCRGLFDEVKSALVECRADQDAALPCSLEDALASIPDLYASLGCESFRELITEFLDGYVPAGTYERFEIHASNCDECSLLLTDVVLAVAACHSVHTYENNEAPEALIERLLAVMPERAMPLRRRIADRVSGLATRLLPRSTDDSRWSLATAFSLSFAICIVLLFSVSDDGTLSGVYRQVRVKAAEYYSRGTDIYSQKDEVVARFEEVGQEIGQLWNSLGGE